MWSAGPLRGRTVYEPVAVNLGTNNLVGAVRYDAWRGAWVYGTAALPLGGAAPFWDSAGTGGRFTLPGSSLRRVSFGSDAGAHGFMFRDAAVQQMGSGGILEAIPFANVSAGAASLELRGGWRGRSLSFAGVTQNRAACSRRAFVLRMTRPSICRAMFAGCAPPKACFRSSAHRSRTRVRRRSASGDGRVNGSATRPLTSASWGFGRSAAIGSSLESLGQRATGCAGSSMLECAAAVVGRWRHPATESIAGAALPTPSAQPGGVLIRIAADDAPDGEISIAGSFTQLAAAADAARGRFLTIRLPLAAGVYHAQLPIRERRMVRAGVHAWAPR